MDPTETTSQPASEPAATPDAAALQAEVFKSRFEAAAVRAGLDEEYAEEVSTKAQKYLADKKLDGTKENLGKFLDEYKAKKPKLFAQPEVVAPARTSTAPVQPNAQPAAP